jgi:hypothetical protein
MDHRSRNIYYGNYTYVNGELKLVFDPISGSTLSARSYQIEVDNNVLYLLPDGQFNRLKHVGPLPNRGKKP